MKNTTNLDIKVHVPMTVKATVIGNLLCCAFEGGSNYWYEIDGYEFPDGISYEDFREGGRFTDPKNYFHPAQIIPLHAGCSVLIADRETEVEPGENRPHHSLDRDNLIRGLEVLAAKYPHHYSDILAENEDADTGDAYLQCCLFGEIVYG